MSWKRTRKSKRERFDKVSLLFAVLAGFLGTEIFLFGLGERYELITYDFRMRHMADAARESPVAIVQVNSESIRQLGKWPWNGGVFAEVHTRLLDEFGAWSVVYDILFDEPNPLEPLYWESLPDWLAEAGYQLQDAGGNPVTRLPVVDVIPGTSEMSRIRDAALGDILFEEAFRGEEDAWMNAAGDGELHAASGRGFLAAAFSVLERGFAGASRQQLSSDVAESWRGFERFAMARTPNLDGGPPEADWLIAPRLALLESAAGCGSTTPAKDTDGRVRRVPLFVLFGDRLYPSLHLQVACDRLRVPLDAVRIQWGRAVILPLPDGSERRVPIGAEGAMHIVYRRPFEAFPGATFHPVYAFGMREFSVSVVNPESFRDRIALVGAAAEALGDMWSVPIAPVYPGMGTVATAIENLIEGDFLRQAPRVLDAALVAGMALVVGVLGGFFREFRLAGLTLLLLAAYAAAACWIFIEKSYWINMTHVGGTGLLSFALVTVHQVAQEQNRRRFVRHVLGRLVSEAVAEELAGSLDPSKLELGGELHVNTMVFTDLSGFTALSEKVSARTMVDVLNEYFGHMIEIIDEEKGYVNKFMGDAIMVIFGHPLDYDDHALRAVRTAVRMQAKNRELQKDWETRGLPVLRMRVGVNTGEVVTGNIGSEKRIEYSVIGDSVNLAQRLESNAPVDGVLISAATFELVKHRVLADKQEPIRVKNKAEPVEVYVVKGMKDSE